MTKPAAMGRAKRLAAWSGIAVPVVAGVAIVTAIGLAPGFSLTGSALSDLGAPGAPTAPVFNTGMIAAGVLGVPFGWLLAIESETRLGMVGATLLGAGFVSLAGVGAFPTGEPLHFPAALAFYLLCTYGLAVAGTGAVLAGRRVAGLAALWVALAHVTAWLLWAIAASFDLVGDGLALPESVGAVLLGGWLIAEARRITGRSS